MSKDERMKPGEDPKDALIAKLSDRLAALEARLGPDEIAAATAPSKDWPRMVNKRGHVKGQIDHPGVLQLKVDTPEALAAALEDGWQEASLDPLDHEDAHALVPAPKARKKTAA